MKAKKERGGVGGGGVLSPEGGACVKCGPLYDILQHKLRMACDRRHQKKTTKKARMNKRRLNLLVMWKRALDSALLHTTSKFIRLLGTWGEGREGGGGEHRPRGTIRRALRGNNVRGVRKPSLRKKCGGGGIARKSERKHGKEGWSYVYERAVCSPNGRCSADAL